MKISYIYIYIYIYFCASCNSYCRKEMDLTTRVQIQDEAICASLHANTNGKCMNSSVLSSSLPRATGPSERKVEDRCLGKSVVHWCTILLLSTHPKSVASSTQTFISINKLAM